MSAVNTAARAEPQERARRNPPKDYRALNGSRPTSRGAQKPPTVHGKPAGVASVGPRRVPLAVIAENTRPRPAPPPTPVLEDEDFFEDDAETQEVIDDEPRGEEQRSGLVDLSNEPDTQPPVSGQGLATPMPAAMPAQPTEQSPMITETVVPVAPAITPQGVEPGAVEAGNDTPTRLSFKPHERIQFCRLCVRNKHLLNESQQSFWSAVTEQMMATIGKAPKAPNSFWLKLLKGYETKQKLRITESGTTQDDTALDQAIEVFGEAWNAYKARLRPTSSQALAVIKRKHEHAQISENLAQPRATKAAHPLPTDEEILAPPESDVSSAAQETSQGRAQPLPGADAAAPTQRSKKKVRLTSESQEAGLHTREMVAAMGLSSERVSAAMSGIGEKMVEAFQAPAADNRRELNELREELNATLTAQAVTAETNQKNIMAVLARLTGSSEKHA